MFYSNRLNNRSNIQELTLEELVNRLSCKSDVFVVSCYYGLDTIQKFFDKMYECGKQGRTTTVIVSSQGSSTDRLISILKDLTRVKLHQTQKLYVYESSSLLHTKLYLSMDSNVSKNTCCLVGSLNLSDNAFYSNEEILVDIVETKDKKAASDYIDSILYGNDKCLINIKDLQNKMKDVADDDIEDYLRNKYSKEYGSVSNSTIKEFISCGYIFFKAQRNFSLTYRQDSLWDKWISNIDPQNRKLLIPNTKNPRLNVYDLLGINEENDETDAIYIKQHSVETNLGYWVPIGKRHDFIQKKIDEIKKQREERYNCICKILAQNSENLSDDSLEEEEPDALKRLKDSFNRLNTLLAEEKKLKPEAFNDLKDEFCAFIQDKLIWFKKEKNKELYNQNGIYFNPMPNFWDDVPAVKEFRESFCDDINLRHSKNGKKVVDVLYKYFELEKGEMDLNKKLGEWEKFDTESFKPKG